MTSTEQDDLLIGTGERILVTGATGFIGSRLVKPLFDRGFRNVWVTPAAGGEPRQVSFLSNTNSGSVLWSPDGTYLLFDTNQRTEDNQIVRVDLVLKTPKFREDRFRDLTGKGYRAVALGTDGQPGTLLRCFDSRVEQTLFIPQLQGG